jgi:hypothetical protein
VIAVPGGRWIRRGHADPAKRVASPARWGYITRDPGIDGTYITTVSTVGLIPVSE